MAGYGFYVFWLSLIALFVLVGLATAFIITLVNHELNAIRNGLQDDALAKEQAEGKKNKKTNLILSIVICVVLCALFTFSLVVDFGGKTLKEDKGSYRVVYSNSMASKNNENGYLFSNNLNDQVRALDLAKFYLVNDANDVGLYRVVTYAQDGQVKLGRIVGLENVSGETLYIIRGDANAISETAPISINQIEGVYKGEKAPFVGAIVAFMTSPVGYLCVLMAIAMVVLVPVVEKKTATAKTERLAEIEAKAKEIPGVEEIVATEIEEDGLNEPEEVDAFGHLVGKKDDRTFDQKIEDATVQTRDRYQTVNLLIERIEGLKLRSGNKIKAYYTGRRTIIKLVVKGKTLNVYLDLDPKDYENTKYVYQDVSAVKKYASTPMRVRLSSDRQAKYANELITALCAKYSLTIGDVPVPKTDIFGHLKGRKQKTFKQKLRSAPQTTKDRYKKIQEFIRGVEQFKVIGEKSLTYKYKNKSVVKMAIKGKTLNVYLALDVNEYENTKYIYQDVSSVKKYASTPMRIKVSSDRQAKWTVELLSQLKEKIVK